MAFSSSVADRLIFIIALSLGTSPLLAQATPDQIHKRDKPADAAELASIAQRGRAIASYDAAAWHATDEVQALKPGDGLVEMYIGQQTSAGWTIAFGKLNPAKDAFLLAFQTTPTADPQHPKVLANTPPMETRDQWLYEARAVEIARSAFGQQSRPYNDVVLPAPAGAWYVYFYPGTTSNDVYPSGADVRYRVSQDGTKIEETHRMHAGYLEYTKPKDGTKTEATYHTAILDDAPEDTDVANVLMMGGLPMYVSGKTFTYKIGADGTPIFLGKTQDLFKNAKK